MEYKFNSQILKAFSVYGEVYINNALAIDAIDLFIAIYCSNGRDKSMIKNCLYIHLSCKIGAYIARTGAIRLNIRAFIVAS